jgi:hypothetical protein
MRTVTILLSFGTSLGPLALLILSKIVSEMTIYVEDPQIKVTIRLISPNGFILCIDI